jgi:hypothetical protein
LSKEERDCIIRPGILGNGLVGERATVSVDLATVDLVRERMRCTYEDARNALQAANGDVVSALANLEKSQSSGVDVAGMTAELLDDVQRLLEAGGAIRKLRVRLGDRVVREVPVEVTAIGAVLIGLLAVLASRLTIDIIRDQS